MRKIIFLFVGISMIACNLKSNDKYGNMPITYKPISKSKIVKKRIPEISHGIITINKEQFIQYKSDDIFYGLTTLNGDTVIKFEEGFAYHEIIDINNDGFKDIRVYEISNCPNQCVNYLFDWKSKKFKLIENCDLDIHLVKGTNFYYSYNRGGCDDMNWESRLYKIENYKAIVLGLICGYGCDSDLKANPQIIEIEKINGNDERKTKLIEKLPYLKYIPQFNDKWVFIENYWAKNYRKFL